MSTLLQHFRRRFDGAQRTRPCAASSASESWPSAARRSVRAHDSFRLAQMPVGFRQLFRDNLSLARGGSIRFQQLI